ncbi:S9 family peptidase [Flavobacterium urocaniciphilum]|uniref:Prolyl tripeptidyl peptidase. Serine peptidase. MEROPS family S09B n=1 Tax=Flavobacterium urocaniciphilum TaxID=1299341 RepID=A0A1H8YTY1_9FLAO|nr:DPP IV N-terminal domain-containing protein [Flavobacterium urocaniciphilum]SEP55579.1 prolyl tripeptidyl peptidase. Serine peptidase. MEROPS family S09B [Flavobacterium urocaniciphilum]
MKKYILSFLLVGSMSFAQKLTIEETVLGPRKYAPTSLVAQQWRKDSKAVTYLSTDFANLLEKNAANGWKETTLATKAEFESALKSKFSEDEFSLRTFPTAITWLTKNTFETEVAGKKNNYKVVFDVTTKQITNAISYSIEGTQARFTKNNNVAWLKDNNIRITSNNKTIEVTNDENPAIVNGSDYVHRQEFGIDRGMWWNEAGTQLAYYRKDETMVGNYPIINWNEREAVNKDIKYPMAGMTSENVTLVIFDVASGKKVTIQTGEPKEQYLTMVSWEPTGKYIFIGILNRDQNHLKFNKYDASTGAFVKTLFEEKATTWVEPQHALTFVPNNPSQFIYQTDFNGFNQMYLYNTDGKLLKNLGFKDVVVTNLVGFDATNSKINYIGTANNGLDRQLYQVDIKSGKTLQLTTVSGTHNASVSSDGMMVLDQYSNTTTPNEISILNIKTKMANTTLVKAENPFTGKIDMPKMELVTITSADGKTPLNGRIIYPANFDATKKYPVMVYVYGGSHAQLVTNRWLGGGGYFDYYMAQQGYVVFTLDNRGSDARGKKFCDVNHRNLGVNEMADQMEGVKYLKSKSFVDADKIGVFGWSFGGFMTTSLMTSQPDTFKVGVAGGPVIDWKYYEIMYGERYMDTPQDNPEGYAKTSLLDKVKNLKGRLLIIHGAQDPVVVQQHSMNFIESSIKAGKQVDYFLYPNHEHNVGGRDRIHMYAKIADYFDVHLKK